MLSCTVRELCGLVVSRLDNIDAFENGGFSPLLTPVALAPFAALPGNAATGPQEHLILLKPELLRRADGVLVDAALSLVLEPLLQAGEIDMAILLRSGAATTRALLLRQYKVLQAFSAKPPGWALRHAMESIWPHADAGPPGKVLTATEAAQRLWDGDVEALQQAWDEMPCAKAGPGLYVRHFEKEGARVAVLNGFFPSQLAWLSQPGGYLLALRLKTNMSLARLRDSVIGTVRPEGAMPGSIRRKLFEARQALGLREVSVSKNAVHVSPNPFDASSGIRHLLGLLGLGADQCGFYRYVRREAPELAACLDMHAKEGALCRLDLALHTDSEDCGYPEGLALLRTCAAFA